MLQSAHVYSRIGGHGSPLTPWDSPVINEKTIRYVFKDDRWKPCVVKGNTVLLQTKVKSKVAHKPRRPTQPELIPVSVA